MLRRGDTSRNNQVQQALFAWPLRMIGDYDMSNCFNLQNYVDQELAASLGYEFSGVDKPTNDKALYGLRYADFVVQLVRAVQEQQLIIEELRKKVELLEKKMENR